MSLSKRLVFFAAIASVAVALAADPGAQGGGGRGGQRGAQAARDSRRTPTGTGVIAGRVLTADTSRPIKRASVVVTGGGTPRATTTDEQGRYRIGGLPAGTYRITAVKGGFVEGTFGQRRASRPGTAIEIADNQQVADADIKLARGGVITGHVFDEDGEPLSRTFVTVLRAQYLRGEKLLAPAGADQTDDRGQFRVFGLPPGEYVVSAAAGGIDRIVAQIAQRGGQVPDEEAADSTGYAPTYYPGVIAAADAGRLKLAASEELTAIDFAIQVVPLATVRGVVAGGTGTVMLLPNAGVLAPAGGGGGRGGLGGPLGGSLAGQNLRTATQPDGSFTIRNVTPGKYTIVARTESDGGAPRMAVQSLVVSGQEVMVALTPVPGTDIAGTVTLEATTQAVPKTFAGFRVTAAAIDSTPLPGRGGRPGDAGETGQFTIGGVFPGRYVIRGAAPGGWVMKSVYLDGRDVTDQPFDVRGERLTGVNVIFTDRIATLAGMVSDARGAAVEGVTVVAFPADADRWHPQSRQIVTARTNKAGKYRIGMIPAGEYLVVAVDDVEQGEWFDPSFLEQIREGATRVSIADGEQRTQDLKGPPVS